MIRTTFEDDVVIRTVDSLSKLEDIVRHDKENTEWETHHMLWDMVEMDITGLESKHIKSLIPHVTEMAEQRQKSKRTAFLVGSDVGFGLSRMLSALVSHTDYQSMVFREKDEALLWLREDQQL